jgi:hypothetical protein
MIPRNEHMIGNDLDSEWFFMGPDGLRQRRRLQYRWNDMASQFAHLGPDGLELVECVVLDCMCWCRCFEGLDFAKLVKDMFP